MFNIDIFLGAFTFAFALAFISRVARDVFVSVVGCRTRQTRKQLKERVKNLEISLSNADSANWRSLMDSVAKGKKIRQLTRENEDLKRINAQHVEVTKMLDNDIDDLRLESADRFNKWKMWQDRCLAVQHAHFMLSCENEDLNKRLNAALARLSRKPKNKAA